MNKLRLSDLHVGQKARVLNLSKEVNSDSAAVSRRLMEMGILEGSLIEVLHEAAGGGDPFAIRVRGCKIALRRSEANLVNVEEIIHE